MSCGSDNKIVVSDTSGVFESAWHDLSPPQSTHFLSPKPGFVGMDSESPLSSSSIAELSVPRIGTPYSQGIFHTDYVKKIKAMEGSNGQELVLFSVGLDCQMRQSSIRPGGGSLQAVTSWDTKASLYSLGARKMSDSWFLVATGGSDGLVKVFDTRTDKKPIMKLRSHSEVVKTIYLPDSPSSSNIVSGSADGSIKVWDLRNAKVQNSLAIHDDSVWFICGSSPSPSDSSSSSLKFYSGGRDGSVYLTDVDASQTRLLFKEPHPILCLAPATQDTLWVSTTDAVITRWEVSSDQLESKGESLEKAEKDNFSRSSINLASSPISSPVHTIGMQSSVEQILESGENPIIPSLSAEKAISKTPKRNSLVSCAVLPDKLRVVTKDNTGRAQVWNVVDLVVERDLGIVNEEVEFVAERLANKRYLPKWFTADVRSGQLTINIEPYPRCTEAAFTDPESIFTCDRDIDRPYHSAVGLVFKKIFRAYLDDYDNEGAQNENEGAKGPNGTTAGHDGQVGSEAIKDGRRSGTESGDMEARPENDGSSSSSETNFLDVIVTLSRDSTHQLRMRASEIQPKTLQLPQWVAKAMEPIQRPRKPAVTIAFTFKPQRKNLFRTDKPDIVYNMHRAFTVAGMAEFIRDRCSVANGVVIPRSMMKVTLEDAELPMTMDLGSIKYFLWKDSSPIPLYYDYDVDALRNAK